MDQPSSNPDDEFSAMQTVYSALASLEQDAQRRVLDYVCSRLGVTTQPVKPPARGGATPPGDDVVDDDNEIEDQNGEAEAPEEFNHLADLFDRTDPHTEADKALVAAYWLQVCRQSDSVEGFGINKELKHLGQGLSNVTRAVDVLRKQKPALMMQLRKSGRSQQARKTYKVTHAGEKAVREMMNG